MYVCICENQSLPFLCFNLVLRVSLLPVPWSERERERPWYGLVTCIYENWIRQRGVLVFQFLLSFVLSSLKRGFRVERECGQPLQLAMFYSSLHFAISTSSYNNTNVKAKQVKCLEAVYNGRDLVAVLPTGYGKSMIFHLLPALLYDKERSESRNSALLRPIVIVVSPLNALTIRRSDQEDYTRDVESGRYKYQEEAELSGFGTRCRRSEFLTFAGRWLRHRFYTSWGFSFLQERDEPFPKCDLSQSSKSISSRWSALYPGMVNF